MQQKNCAMAYPEQLDRLHLCSVLRAQLLVLTGHQSRICNRQWSRNSWLHRVSYHFSILAPSAPRIVPSCGEIGSSPTCQSLKRVQIVEGFRTFRFVNSQLRVVTSVRYMAEKSNCFTSPSMPLLVICVQQHRLGLPGETFRDLSWRMVRKIRL
jgi:hypothetical protein